MDGATLQSTRFASSVWRHETSELLRVADTFAAFWAWALNGQNQTYTPRTQHEH